MKQNIPILASLFACFFIFKPAFSQTCSDCRYINQQFDSVTVSTVQFGRGPKANGDMQDLFMDVYRPFGDTVKHRPVLVFAFGGAFIKGSRDDWYVKLVCDVLAKTGYVVASIDYRIYSSIEEMVIEIFSAFPPQQMRIFFRPMQDMRAAVQYLKADYAELGDNYGIDTSMIIIGGASSGAMTSLMTAYCDKDSEMAEMGGGSLAPLDDLGGFYSTSGFYPNYSWKAAATLNVSGALINADWVEAGDIPMVSTHGDADKIVPYKEGGFAGLTLGTFNMQGSYLIDSVARAKGVCSYLYTMVGKDHPSDTIGIEYLKSVVYRLQLQMHALVHGRSFCCPLNVSAAPDDTLRYEPGGAAFTATAHISNDNGNAQLRWCGIPCLAASDAASITLQPDTGLHYLAAIAYENQCQAMVLNMVKADTLTSIGNDVNVAGNAFTIFPHPASASFTIDMKNCGMGEKRLEIFDVNGKMILSRTIAAQNKMETIDASKLTAGSYIVRLITQGAILPPQKIVILK